MQEEYKEKEAEAVVPQKKKSYVRKILKGILYVVLGIIGLNIILFVLLSIPAVQQKVVGLALERVQEMVNTKISIDNVRLNFWGNVGAKLTGVYIEDQSRDTLLYVEKLEATLNPLLLLSNKLSIGEASADNFTIKVSKENPDADFNFQFLIDAFAGDTTSTDTTASSLKIAINDIKLNRGRLSYDVFSEPETPGEFNASHIRVRDLSTNLSLPSIDVTALDAHLKSMSFAEKSGLEISDLKAKVTSAGAVFFLNDAELLLPNSNLAVPEAQYNMLTDAFSVTANKSVLSPVDLLPFLKDLKHLRNNIELEATLSGKLPAVSINDLLINYGEETQLKGSAAISDYQNYGKSDLKLNIANLRITPEAITDFAKIGDSTFVAPDMLNTLGTIRLEGTANGSLENLLVNAEARARQGALLMSAKASTDTTFRNFRANVKLQTQNFNLGSLMQMPQLGRLSADVNLTASQTSSQSLKADAAGRVHSFRYDTINFVNVPFTAYYNSAKMGGWLKADQKFGRLEAKVDMTQSSNPRIDLDIDLKKLQLDKFIELSQWNDPELSFLMKGNVIGTDLNKLQADVIIDSLKFTHDSLIYKSGIIALKAGIDEDPMKKYIKISSSVFEAGITGNYNFETLSDEIMFMMNTYLPGFFEKPKRKILNKNNFDFYLSVQNTEELGRILDLPLNVINPLSVNGSLNMPANNLKMSANVPYLKYDNMDIRNTNIDISTTDSLINIDGKSLLALEGGDVGFKIDGAIMSDTIGMKLNVRRDSADMVVDVNLEAKAHFEYSKTGNLISAVQFSPSAMDIGKLNLTFMPAHILNEGTRTSVSNFGFMLGRGRTLNKYFGVEGVISDQPQDTLNISFFHANLGYILQAFDVYNVSTIADGDVKLTNIMSMPEIYTDNMRLSDIMIWGDTLGTLNLKSQWNNSQRAIKLDALLEKGDVDSSVDGWIYPQRDSLNLDVNIDRLSLHWLEPFMAGTLNQVSGSISTGLKVQGKMTAPTVNGWLGVNDTYLGIDYTNVTYHISDTIQITPDRIGFENLIVKDPENNSARVNALVTHRDFEDLQFSVDMTFRDFMVLNTESRTDSLFYGKLYVTGTSNIKGNMDDIRMDLRVRNAKQSRVDVLIPQTSDAGVFQSIVFINTPEEDQNNGRRTEPRAPLPLNLTANITLSPTITLGVIINPLTGDEMQIRGSGLINFSYDMESETMNAFGDYSVSDGFVRLRLQNLVTMEFRIRDGSKLIFNGDPMKTNFDITAYRRVRANLTTLDPSFGDDGSSPRVIVDCVLGIKGNMDRMDLTYDISLPEASDDIRQRVNALIVTDQQKVTQFASLLAIGAFQPQSGTSAPSGNIAESMLTGVASSALSAGLNSIFSKVMGSNWEIGTNFDSADGTFDNMDMTVSLSRRFLNDRLEFNTNLGYRTDQTNSNSFIGDFDVTYALNRSIKLKVFNKTNDRYYKQADTTQGIGIVYTREAKTIRELFRFFRKKRPQRTSEQQASSQ